MQIMAFCPNGHAFRAPFGFDDDININIQMTNIAVICPYCEGVGRVPDGIYRIVKGVLAAIDINNLSVEHKDELENLLLSATEQLNNRRAIFDSFIQASPNLKFIASLLPKTREELYQFLTILLMMIQTIKGDGGDKQTTNIHNTVNNYYQTAPAEDKYDSSKKILKGHEKCYCKSGKQYKNCHMKVDSKFRSIINKNIR